ncbi:hypothetical protein KSP35_03220 [Aquihabitans sp. G128]|uniref:hypothetical protein n=1 Tax=Aquihabitans sp. G128 TaxID=2849779 RepID=UPI001C23C1E1|nr:hypothetical protein [Aquihabitans sp. G128]QXC61856.1 hypothetical protein KSP35_03220 [Aquihabitans sp. G128]
MATDLPAPPSPPSGDSDPTAPIQVDVTFGRRQRITYHVGTTVVAALAVLVLVGAVTAPAVAANVGLAVLGLLLLAGAAQLVRLRARVFAPRSLVFDGRGIRQVAVDRRAFEVEWSELTQARVSYARKASPLRSPLALGGVTDDAPPGGNPARHLAVSTFVRLDLVPADRSFLDRHPNLKPFRRFTKPPGGQLPPAPWADDVGSSQAIIRIPFGDLPEVAAALDAGLRRFAGPRHHPPVNEGLALGFTYS